MQATDLERAVAAAGHDRERAMDRRRRRERGVVHTPPEVARLAARMADAALRLDMGLDGGLADPRVAIVDPACGPGAFLAAALAVAGDRETQPLSVWGLDVDADAIDVAHAQIAQRVAAARWPLAFRRVNTLRSPALLDEVAGGGVVAILGNPPWRAGPRTPAAPHLRDVLDEFRREPDGSALRERKVGVLADTYVRFLAWALACLRRAGGVFALVTNASFLDGPVHRGMRAVLARDLDAIDIVDLGGNAMLAPGRERDENVCGVRPGIAVTMGVRRSVHRGIGARARYLALRGRAADKLAALAHVTSEGLTPFVVNPPHHRFGTGGAAPSRFSGWLSLPEAMPFHREGVQTNRDAVATDADRERLLARLRAFAAGGGGSSLVRARRRLRHYDPERARAAVADALARDPDGTRGISVARIAYRPGDLRWFAPIASFCHRPRGALIAAMAHAPLALVTVRKDRGHAPWAHFGAVAHVPDSSFLSARSSCRTRAFPVRTPDGRDNLAPSVAARLSELVGRAIDAREFAHYALAVLASKRYRKRFDLELHLDYPRVPCPTEATRFDAVRAAGADLAALFCAACAPSETFDARVGDLDALLSGIV